MGVVSRPILSLGRAHCGYRVLFAFGVSSRISGDFGLSFFDGSHAERAFCFEAPLWRGDYFCLCGLLFRRDGSAVRIVERTGCGRDDHLSNKISLVLLVGAALYQFKSDVYVAVEMLAVAVLALLVPPLVSFTLYFCFMHSVRHIFRSVQITKQFSAAYHVKMVVLPMAGVFFAVLISWFLLKDQSIDQRIIQIVFLGLAALTVPHMVIIERMKWDSRVRGDMSNV